MADDKVDPNLSYNKFIFSVFKVLDAPVTYFKGNIKEFIFYFRKWFAASEFLYIPFRQVSSKCFCCFFCPWKKLWKYLIKIAISFFLVMNWKNSIRLLYDYHDPLPSLKFSTRFYFLFIKLQFSLSFCWPCDIECSFWLALTKDKWEIIS